MATEAFVNLNGLKSKLKGHSSQAPSNRTEEEPNLEALYKEAKHPLYKGCKECHTPLSVAAWMMRQKLDYNLSEDCIDDLVGYMKHILPKGNVWPSSYYEIEKLLIRFPEFYPDRHNSDATQE